MAVSEEKIQESCQGGGSSSHCPCWTLSAQTLARMASRAAGKSGNNFPAASKFAGHPFRQGISDHILLGFSELSRIGPYRTHQRSGEGVLRQTASKRVFLESPFSHLPPQAQLLKRLKTVPLIAWYKYGTVVLARLSLRCIIHPLRTPFPPGSLDCDHTQPQLILNAQQTSIQGEHLVWVSPL